MTNSPYQAFIDGIMAQADRMIDAEHTGKGILHLGELILKLETLPESAAIFVDTVGEGVGRQGFGGVDSYRGYYRMLAIEPGSAYETVGQALNRLRKAVGEEFTGYKGGEYVMDRHTAVWVSDYGSASGLGVVDVVPVTDADTPTYLIVTRQMED